MEIVNTPNEVINTAASALNFFDLVYSKVEIVKSKKLTQQNYLRAYYFEVINNLELLNAINIAKFRTIDVSSTLVQKFISKLDTQIGATILFSEDIDTGSNLYKLLKTKGKIENKNKMISVYQKGKEVNCSRKILYENILQAISFTVVKIEVLRRLSTLDFEEKEYLHKILLEKRIINIKERFVMIKTVMDQFDGIQELTR